MHYSVPEAGLPSSVTVCGITSEPGLNGTYYPNGTFPHTNGEERPQYMKTGSRCYVRYVCLFNWACQAAGLAL